jgi:hypothetical protein
VGAAARGRGARLSRTGNKAAASGCLALRRSAARGHVTAAGHQPLRSAAPELEIGWDIPPSRASAWLGVATRPRVWWRGGARLLFFAPFGSGARCVCLCVCQWKPRGVVAT